MPSRRAVRPALQAIGRALRRQRQGGRSAARARRCSRRSSPRSTAPRPTAGARSRKRGARACSSRRRASSTSTTAASPTAPRKLLLVDRRKAALLGVSQQDDRRARCAPAWPARRAAYLHDESKYPAAATIQLPAERQGDLDALLQLGGARRRGPARADPRARARVSDTLREQPVYHKDLLPVATSSATWPARLDSPLYGMFEMRGALRAIATPGGGTLGEHFIRQPADAYRDYALKWDGEWQITYETFRDMGAAYAVGLVLIYLLVVAQFGSYLTPLIIMAPIPLTIIGVMPGHALLGAQYTATSMIGMIALAGIIVRNSILLVDFINLQVAAGHAARAGGGALGGHARAADRAHRPGGDARRLLHPRRPDLQRARDLADLRHPGRRTVLTLVVIPLLYFVAYRRKPAAPLPPPSPQGAIA